jgi:hypothetical protein
MQRSKAAAVNGALSELKRRASLEDGELAEVVGELCDVVQGLVDDALRVERNALGGAADLRERPRRLGTFQERHDDPRRPGGAAA